MSIDPSMDRRQFASGLAFGSTALVASTLTGLQAAIADDRPAEKRREDSDVEPPPEEPREPVVRPTEEALLLTCLTQRYPSEHFDEEALQGIYRDLRGDVARGRILSEFPLKNSDEPAFAFRAYRGPQ